MDVVDLDSSVSGEIVTDDIPPGLTGKKCSIVAFFCFAWFA